MASLPINKIRVRNRYRKNLGDIKSLASSIKELGLLHPIVIRPDGRLIAGERRLAACKSLGWKSVPVTRVDLDDIVRGEFAENAFRKNFLPSEVEAIGRALEPHEKAAAKERQRQHGGTAPGRHSKKHSGKFPGVKAGPETELGPLRGCLAGAPPRFKPSLRRRRRTLGDLDRSLPKWTGTEELTRSTARFGGCRMRNRGWR